MAQPETRPTLSDVFSAAWKETFTLWPLLFVKLLFSLFQYATLFLCLFLLFGAFLTKDWDQISQGFQHPRGYDWTQVGADLSGYFTDFTWIGIAAMTVLLYIIWWSLLDMVAQGGIYGALWAHEKEGQKFSLGEFFKHGFRFLWPIFAMQTLFFLISLGLFAFFMVGMLLEIGLCGLLSHHVLLVLVLVLFPGIPMFVGFLLFCLGMGGYNALCLACLTRGSTATRSIADGFEAFKADGWRAGLGLFLAVLIYFVASVGIGLVLGIFGMIPFIGFLFQLLKIFLSLCLYGLFTVFMAALSVRYVREREAQA